MNSTIRIYIVALVILFIGAVAIEFSKPVPIDWSRNYNETLKSPYGTYIFFNELKNLFPQSTLEELGVTAYEYFNERYNWDYDEYEVDGTFVYIDEAMRIDDISAQELLDFASFGNDVFISSSYLPERIKDSLNLELSNHYDFTGTADLLLANRRSTGDSITIERGLNNIFFSELDSLNTTVLGYQRFSKENKINFIRVDHGEGRFLLHLQPVVFTNYSLLKNNNKRYTERVISYLNETPIFFDSKNKKRLSMSQSPMRYILSKPALKWAWLLGLISILIFVIFNAKRKQRIVRIIKPHENTTVAFTKTIGNLYYETRDHDNVIDKKITYFLEFIRRNYYLDTQILDEKFMKLLALKSGRKPAIVNKLVKLIAHLRAKASCSEEDLLELNRALENFYIS